MSMTAMKQMVEALKEDRAWLESDASKEIWDKNNEAIAAGKQAIAEAEKQVTYIGNGTAGREADVKPTGFFFQMPKPVGDVYGWHGSGQGQPMCRFDTTESEMPVGTKLYTHPQRQPLTDEQINSILVRVFGDLAVRTPPGWRKVVRAIEAAHGIGPNE
jgi:hypothetical protein